MAPRTNTQDTHEHLLSPVMTNLVSSFVRFVFLEGVFAVWREASPCCLTPGSFAGCLSHPGSIRGCQAEGPGVSILQHPPDPLPHLVPWGESRAKFLNIFTLPTQCHTHPEAFLQLYPSSVPSQHFSIYCSALKSDWHVVIEETKPPPPPGTCFQQLFFLLFLYGIPTFEDDEGKKKKRI